MVVQTGGHTGLPNNSLLWWSQKERQTTGKGTFSIFASSLPPAYVVRREGNVLTHVYPSICLSTVGVPISHNALQHYPECHGADTGGGYPYPIMLCNISQNALGQTPGGVPCQVQLGVGVPCQVQPGGVPCWGVPN